MAAFAPSTGNPYQTSILDARNPLDFRAQSDRANRLTQESAWNAQRKALQDAMSGAGSADAEMKANRQRITDLTEGRAGDLANDPRMNQAMDFFGKVLNGSKLPFSEETQRAQLNQQANGTAAANASQLRALEEAIVARGGSLQDPSFQAQKQEMMANRQGQNLDALGRMLAQAGTANFNAQAQGANSLAGIRSGQNNQINQMDLAGAGYRAQDFRDVPTGGIAGSGTVGGSVGQLGGGGSFIPFTGGYATGAASAGNGLAGGTGRAASAPTAVGIPTTPSWAPPVAKPMVNPAIKPAAFGTPFMKPIGPNYNGL